MNSEINYFRKELTRVNYLLLFNNMKINLNKNFTDKMENDMLNISNEVTSLYILSDPIHEKVGQFKVGVHSGNTSKLLKRYRTAIPEVNIKLFVSMAPGKAKEIEDKIKIKFSPNRVVGSGGNKSEYYQISLKILYEFILPFLADVAPNSLEEENGTGKDDLIFRRALLINNSLKILSPYEELLEKMPKLVAEYMTYEKYQRGIRGIMSVLIDIILHNKEKKWLVCYERDGQDFYKKKADQIEVDSQANEFFDEFLKALKPKITEYIDETYSRDENMSEVKKEINVIKKLFISSSLERKKCTKNLAESLYLSI
jgi:hypothetical protein